MMIQQHPREISCSFLPPDTFFNSDDGFFAVGALSSEATSRIEQSVIWFFWLLCLIVNWGREAHREFGEANWARILNKVK